MLPDSSDALRPDEWANVAIAKLTEAIGRLPITDDERYSVRALVADALPRIWPTYAAAYAGPRSACGCPDRPDEDYEPHSGQPCEWSHWHPNEVSAELREDRYCWLCGAMETQILRTDDES